MAPSAPSLLRSEIQRAQDPRAVRRATARPQGATAVSYDESQSGDGFVGGSDGEEGLLQRTAAGPQIREQDLLAGEPPGQPLDALGGRLDLRDDSAIRLYAYRLGGHAQHLSDLASLD